jgi:PAS domain S-box-containing protein
MMVRSDEREAGMAESGVDTPMNYRGFFELSSEMLATATLEGYFDTLNPAFMSVLGYTADELRAAPCVDFIHPDDREATLLEIAKLNTGEHRVGFENRYRCKDGSYRSLRWSATPSVEEGRVYAVAIDVTESRQKDAALAKLVAELKRSNEDLSQFAYVASHDLSEPLRVVAGHVELLARRYQGQLDEDADRYIWFAVDGCTRMRSLIEDLLAFSRVGHEDGTTGPVDLQQSVAEVLTSLEPLIRDHGAEVSVGALPTVIGSPSQFSQIFANLVANATKFSRVDVPPAIRIESARVDGAWQIEVRDNGIGIQPEFAERIFGIFQRLHTRDEYPGTGIGLSLCRKMVELRGGRIWCQPADPHGTSFFFTVPDEREPSP